MLLIITASYSANPVGMSRVVWHKGLAEPFDHSRVSPLSNPSAKIVMSALACDGWGDVGMGDSSGTSGSAVDADPAIRNVATIHSVADAKRTLFITAMPFPQTIHVCAIA